ncbi:DUF6510 family protein [Microbacterium sp. NPDC087665]|uniref:DUF6510 family protein n=1 Tax=Microbacterium sp. NPDC087665 TaxID=3364194 RepID=UPI0037F7566A
MHAHPGHHERVDGNAAGGYLLDIFGRDMTTARATCAHCERSSEVADAVAEVDAAGVILLCRGCGRTLLTYVRGADGEALVIGGLRELRWTKAVRGVVGPAGIEPTTSTV